MNIRKNNQEEIVNELFPFFIIHILLVGQRILQAKGYFFANLPVCIRFSLFLIAVVVFLLVQTCLLDLRCVWGFDFTRTSWEFDDDQKDQQNSWNYFEHMQLSIENSYVFILMCDDFPIVSSNISQHWVPMVNNRKLLLRLIVALLESLLMDVE